MGIDKCYTEKKLRVPLYGTLLSVILTNDGDRLERTFCGTSFPKVYASTLNNVDDKSKGVFIVLNLDNDNIKVTHGTIAHEALHAVNIIMDMVGVREDRSNDEADTYLIEWIVNEIYRAISEVNMSNKIHFKYDI